MAGGTGAGGHSVRMIAGHPGPEAQMAEPVEPPPAPRLIQTLNPADRRRPIGVAIRFDQDSDNNGVLLWKLPAASSRRVCSIPHN